MRTSRDVLRPLAALVVVLAAVALVSNVAAYRAATTTARHTDHVGDGACPKAAASADPDADGDRSPLDTACPATAAPPSESATRRARSDDDGDGDESRQDGVADDDDATGRPQSDGSNVTVVTETGAS